MMNEVDNILYTRKLLLHYKSEWHVGLFLSVCLFWTCMYVHWELYSIHSQNPWMCEHTWPINFILICLEHNHKIYIYNSFKINGLIQKEKSLQKISGNVWKQCFKPLKIHINALWVFALTHDRTFLHNCCLGSCEQKTYNYFISQLWELSFILTRETFSCNHNQ